MNEILKQELRREWNKEFRNDKIQQHSKFPNIHQHEFHKLLQRNKH